jgi:hypothetical protein
MINFYHFTGDIGMENDDNELHVCRLHHLHESFSTKLNRKHVEKLWYEKHENPALLLHEYFSNKGI